MTYEEALNYNQKWNETQAFNDLERYLLREEKPAMKAVAIAMKALEKQIPKKPIKKSLCGYYCANCDGQFPLNIPDSEDGDFLLAFCPECGRKQDWSDYE